jgi:hypothetical protein
MAEVVEALEALATRESAPVAKPWAWSRLWSWLCRIFAFRARSASSAGAAVGSSNVKTFVNSVRVTHGDQSAGAAVGSSNLKTLANSDQVTHGDQSAGAAVGSSNVKTLANSDQVTLGSEKDAEDCTQTMDATEGGGLRKD